MPKALGKCGIASAAPTIGVEPLKMYTDVNNNNNNNINADNGEANPHPERLSRKDLMKVVKDKEGEIDELKYVVSCEVSAIMFPQSGSGTAQTSNVLFWKR
jgi:hypothetical protein